jgi:hypothetical protein
MDPKHVRRTVENLLADLQRNPAIGRPSWMRRYGRPLGFGIALGIGGAAGCGDSGNEKHDALPTVVDAYGVRDLPAAIEKQDAPPSGLDGGADTRDALPGPIDVYGVNDYPKDVDRRDAPPPGLDGAETLDVSRDVLAAEAPPPGIDGATAVDVSPVDTRDALPLMSDAYGVQDVRDALPLMSDAYGVRDMPAAFRVGEGEGK